MSLAVAVLLALSGGVIYLGALVLAATRRPVEAVREHVQRDRLRARLQAVEARRRLHGLHQEIADAMVEHAAAHRRSGR